MGKEHREQKSLERKAHKHHSSSEGVEKSSKKRSSDHHEQRHRQTSDSDTLESTKSNHSGGKQHRERKSSKHRHSEHSEEKSSHSNKENSKHHKHDHSSNGGAFTKEEGRKIVRDGHLIMDEEVDLTTSFKGKSNKKDKSKHQNGDSLSRDSPTRESVDLDNLEDIYDRPKVPPVRYIPP